jgi:hypothetical protein
VNDVAWRLDLWLACNIGFEVARAAWPTERTRRRVVVEYIVDITDVDISSYFTRREFALVGEMALGHS